MFAQVKRVVGEVLVVAVSVLGAVGCSSAGETNSGGSPLTAGPVVTPSLPAATPVVAPSVVVTSAGIPEVVQAIPLAARQRTAAGAEAFVRYYLDVSNRMGVNPRSGQLSPLSTANCRTCVNWEETADELLQEKRRYAGPPMSLVTIGGLSGLPETDKQYDVGARVREGAQPLVDATGRVVERFPVQEGTYIFTLVWAGQTWKTEKIQVLQENQ